MRFAVPSLPSLLSLLSLSLVACAHAPPQHPVDELFHDELFGAPTQPIDPAAALAVSPQMRDYVSHLAHAGHREERRMALMKSLYRPGDLKLEYDAAITRTAAQAFAARSGNCLALVLMTGALARELDIGVRYQTIVGQETWDRVDGLYIAIGHVNLVLLDKPFDRGISMTLYSTPLLVDFVPPKDKRVQRTRTISEDTVLAMYLNNRAVETMVEGRLDDAYAFVRSALRRDPGFDASYHTLSQLYRLRQRADLAESALARVLERSPDDLHALGNAALVLRDLGRGDEAARLEQRVRDLEPRPPYLDFDAGLAAIREQRYADARDRLEQGLDRDPYHPEFEYWLAVAYDGLGERAKAQAHLERAVVVSSTRHDREIYAAKLDRIRAVQ